MAETTSSWSKNIQLAQNLRDHLLSCQGQETPTGVGALALGSVTFLGVVSGASLWREDFGGCYSAACLLSALQCGCYCVFPEVHHPRCRWWVRCTMCELLGKQAALWFVGFLRVPRQMFTDLAGASNICFPRDTKENISPDWVCMVCVCMCVCGGRPFGAIGCLQQWSCTPAKLHQRWEVEPKCIINHSQQPKRCGLIYPLFTHRSFNKMFPHFLCCFSHCEKWKVIFGGVNLENISRWGLDYI